VVSNLPLLKIILVIIFTSLLILFSVSPIHAQTLSLSIWPPLLEAQLQPGQTITQNYRLKNQGDDTLITANLFPLNQLMTLVMSNSPSKATNHPLSAFSNLMANLYPSPSLFKLVKLKNSPSLSPSHLLPTSPITT